MPFFFNRVCFANKYSLRNSIPDPELLKQMRHISNVKLTIDSTFTSQGQLLLIDLQQDMVSVHNMFISFNTLCNASNPNYIQLASSQWNGLHVPWLGSLYMWKQKARKDYMRQTKYIVPCTSKVENSPRGVGTQPDKVPWFKSSLIENPSDIFFK